MLVKDVMQRNVIVANESIKIRKAASLMGEHRIGSLVILRRGKVVGILTERDVLNAIAEGKSPELTAAKEIMSKEVITISPTDTIDKATEIMAEKRIKKLPVMDGERLVGIVTATDIATIQPKLIKYLANLLAIRISAYKGG